MIGDIIDKAVDTVGKFVLKTPKTFAEACWRFVSYTAVTSICVSSLLIWRYPRIVNRFFGSAKIEEQVIAEIFRRNPHAKEEVMTLIGGFIARYNPSQISLVNWTSQTGIVEVWSNEDSTRWPTSTNGVMSQNMRDAAGHLIFDECWLGRLDKASHIMGDPVLEENDWLICGISDSFDIWGYVIVHWEGSSPPDGAEYALNHLARAIERVTFSNIK